MAASSVEFLTGFKSDLQALGIWCREHGAYFVVDAIQSLEDLGAGFSLATHDLEIRGAGELLGAFAIPPARNIGNVIFFLALGQYFIKGIFPGALNR